MRMLSHILQVDTHMSVQPGFDGALTSWHEKCASPSGCACVSVCVCVCVCSATGHVELVQVEVLGNMSLSILWKVRAEDVVDGDMIWGRTSSLILGYLLGMFQIEKPAYCMCVVAM